ncbi:DUF1801 domain-containing protein [Pararhodobacter sp. SW119]|uniref:DUF1801 domain-containing protein n=1 Tax=Pararhodobacter sp. SW119 TaxID=2780075 RepID=UPI001AE0D2C3|nr:DUF1801 domain-containing protein [Pararhodobacter sp. SW119]
MQIDDRLGTFEDVTASAGGFAPVLGAVRSLVEDLHPDAIETASRKEQTVTWGYPGGKMKAGYAYARAFKAHVNLGFFQGAHLPDPEGLLDGTGKTLRHVKLRLPEEALAPAIRDLLIAARDERRAALNLN